MNLINSRIWVLALFLALALGACKDDKKDDEPPVVEMLSPNNNQSFDVFDQVSVRANITDNEKIEFVSIRLVDENLQPVLPTRTYDPEDALSYELDRLYHLDDVHLESGKYFIRVNASDGENETKAYVEVNITAAPLEKEGIVLVSNAGNNIEVGLVDQDQVWTSLATFPSDYLGSAVSSFGQQLTVCGEAAGGVNSINLSSQAVTEIVSVVNPQIPTFSGFDFHDDINYVMYRSGKIEGYNHNYTLQFNSPENSMSMPLRAFPFGDQLVTHEQLINGGNRELVFYFYISGFAEDNMPFEQDVVQFSAVNEQNIHIFSNDAGIGRITNLNITEAAKELALLKTFPGGDIRDVITISPGNYVIAHDLGLYFYSVASGQITLANGLSAQALAWDEANGQILAGVGDKLYIYQFNTGSLSATWLNTIQHTAPISDVHVWYNK